MNNEAIVNLMLTGVMFALIMLVLIIGLAFAVSVYFLGVPPDISFLIGAFSAIVVGRAMIEAIEASI